MDLNVNLAVMDAENLEFPDGSFDTVVFDFVHMYFSKPSQGVTGNKTRLPTEWLDPASGTWS